MIRLLLLLGLLGGFVWFGAGVQLGKHTLFGHVARIWTSNEAGDLKDGVKEKWNSQETQDAVSGAKNKAGPAFDRVKRGARAAMDEARRTPDAGPRL